MKTLPLTRDETNAFDRTDRALSRSWAEKLLLFVEASHLRACALLLVVSLACFLPGFVGLQPMDRDEPRFAQASKQMVESGDFIDIRFQDEARHKKPVGIYWLQSASVLVAEAIGLPDARTTIAVYRVPSLIGAIGAVLLTYWAALALARRREAFLAAAFLGASVILMVEARLAKTDAMLLACIVASMGGLARAYLARGAARLPTPTVLLFWVAVALGVLIKGPVILLFAGLPAIALSIHERSMRWLGVLRPWLGLAIVLAICGPWFLAITWRAGADFFAASAGDDMLGKLGTAQSYHWAPPGTYLALFYVTFWPAAILASIAVPFAWINRQADVVRFLIAWVVPAWIVFELVPTKLPHYVMPLYPALAILTALALTRGFVGPHRPLAKTASVVLALVPVGLMVGLPLAGRQVGDGSLLLGMPVVVASALIALLAVFYFLRRAVIAAAIVGVGSAMVLSLGVFGFVQPLLRSLKISENLAVVARSVDCPDPRVATLGYREPSLVFLVGTDLRMLGTGAEAVAFLEGGGCRVAFVERRFQGDFLQALDGASSVPALTTRVRGFNINGGRPVDIGVYVARQ
jgi:4-amino-4-deoxy-L-arabinose transferase-like glycosyltransferase